ncbi:helix-turn-helix transcriptional regulator [Solwaraspora sp. WMMB335]|uniref:helix-turn-helix transcriptional regulator n=1 Tax=Solwaraspora sp. WMMB335 TaxID=3404118 RepID=UPI003B961BA9
MVLPDRPAHVVASPATGYPGTGPGLDAQGSGISATTLRDHTVNGKQPDPQLLDHDELILVTAGHGSHDIDFVTYPCRPGTLLRARAGQVVWPGGQPGLDAVIVRWPARNGGQPADPYGAVRWQLAGEDEDAIINEVSQLVVDTQRPRRSPLIDDLLRHQLRVLLVRIALLPTGDADAANSGSRQEPPDVGEGSSRWVTFRRFRYEVERDYARTRRVEAYAERLQCAVRTLTRASLTVTGRTAKQIIDDRVMLQAKRLLAATDQPVAEVGQLLGFAEPTNFGRFVQREIGHSPGAFRAAVRGQHR